MEIKLHALLTRMLKIENIDSMKKISDVPSWDSLTHILIICEIEKTFGFQFTDHEIISVRTVADLEQIVRLNHL